MGGIAIAGLFLLSLTGCASSNPTQATAAGAEMQAPMGAASDPAAAPHPHDAPDTPRVSTVHTVPPDDSPPVRHAASSDDLHPARPLAAPMRIWTADTDVFWIGGAADKAPFMGVGPHHHLLSVMNRWKDVLPGRHSYWGYHELDAIVRAVQECRREREDAPVVLIGHSFGGATALRVARHIEKLDPPLRPVELVITLDAVWPLAVEPPDHAGCWINVHPQLDALDGVARIPLAGPPLAGILSLLVGRSGSDTVATVGGQIGFRREATLDVSGPFDHGASSAMLAAGLETWSCAVGVPVSARSTEAGTSRGPAAPK